MRRESPWCMPFQAGAVARNVAVRTRWPYRPMVGISIGDARTQLVKKGTASRGRESERTD